MTASHGLETAPPEWRALARELRAIAGAHVPGLQFVAVDARGVCFESALGWAGLRERRPMTLDTTLLAYSMTKTVTAIAALQLVEAGALALHTPLDELLPGTPYAGHGITIAQLITHTSGLPNPIPLRWAHLASEAAGFDEAAAFERVMKAHPRLTRPPGRRFAYTNLGYWLLGRALERVSGQPFARLVHERIVLPLGLGERDLGFAIPDPAAHAGGYLARYSAMNLLKGLVTERRFWGGYEGRWLRIRDHLPDGAAFGGLVGTARAFARLLHDQLQPESRLLQRSARAWLATPQSLPGGTSVPMTLGWHVDRGGTLFKEGGGAGFHAEMRLDPRRGTGCVVMVNSTTFDTRRFLDRVTPLVPAPRH